MGCLVLVCDRRESGMVESACVQYRAFSQELPPEIFSRDGRVTALTVYGVFAPDELRLKKANCGWYRGRIAFRPDLWDGRSFYFYR